MSQWHPQLNTETLLKSATVQKKYLDNDLKFDIHLGGNEAFRSLCKTAVNFYLYKGGDSKNIRHLIPYIKDGLDKIHVVNFLYLNQEPILKQPKELLHSIIIRGNTQEKLLFAYIELFDFYKVIMMLNDLYEDRPIEYSYFFDVLTRTEVSRSYELDLTKYDIQNTLQYGISYEDKRTKLIPRLETVIRKALEKQSSEHIHSLLETALNNFFKKFEHQNLTLEEQQKILVEEIMKQITPWLIHILKNERTPN